MKTSIKFFAAIAIMMGFTMSAKAQQTANFTIAGKATVSAQVTVAKVTDLDFNNVTPGVVKTINFANAVTAGTATGLESTGQFTITKGTNTQVTLAFTTLPTTLALSGGAGLTNQKLAIAYTAQLSKAPLTALSITTPAQGNTVVVSSGGGTADYYAAESFQLDLGGTVTPLSSQASGIYTSDIILTATYN